MISAMIYTTAIYGIDFESWSNQINEIKTFLKIQA